VNETIAGSRISPQQKRIWLLQQADSRIYRAGCRLLLRGPLDLQRLRQSLDAIVARHEILRTSFRRLPGMTFPVQVVDDSIKFDLTTYGPGQLPPELERELLQEEAENSPLSLEQHPLLQFRLTELSTEQHELQMSAPMLCADFVTFVNLSDEFAAAYTDPKAFSLRSALQYADIAEWQNQVLESGEKNVGHDYWANVSVTSPSSTPQRKPRTKRGSWLSRAVEIDPDLARKIISVADQSSTSVESILLSCWQILIWKLNLEREVTVGVYSTGRNYEELGAAFGLFAKYLPFKSRPDPPMRFSDLLETTQRQLAEMRMVEEYWAWPQETTFDEAAAPLWLAYGFDFFSWPESRKAAGLVISISDVYTRCDRLDLKLSVVQREKDLTAKIEYDAAAFGDLDVAFIAEQIRELIKNAVDSIETCIRELRTLGEFECHKLTVEWNQSPAVHCAKPLVHELFEQHAKRNPHAVAVSCGNEELSYGELHRRSDLLAAHLRRSGLGAESCVAICLRRSVTLVVALLGVLKSGAAYLPLDPACPPKRLNFIIQDAAAGVLLTEHSLRTAFEPGVAEMICLDGEWSQLAALNDEAMAPVANVAPESSAYLIYTSGSTGNPKAVVIEHRQLANYVHSLVERCDLDRTTGMASVSTLATDLGNTAIFSALATGGCLHLVPQAVANDAELFWTYVEGKKIEALKIVPSHLALLLDGVSEVSSRFPLKLLILGGEAAEKQLIDRVRELNPDCRIINHYGPTETTIGVLTCDVRNTNPDGEFSSPPLGRPLGNVTAYVLDAEMRPAGVGMAGELYIGGTTVGRGYLKRPDLTADRFVPNPFELTRGGDRLYRTGDRARFRADGNIEFLGRMDRQVKIRGHRIELGEIESTLRESSQVRSAVVINHSDSGSEAKLTAYVLLHNDHKKQDPKPALRRFLEDRLPQHMIPSAFVVLDRMPLTASGKIDMARLPLPVSDAGYVAPRSPVEETMAEIWRDVLGIDRVGVFDNFFDRGGHSISAARVVTRVRQAFHVDTEVVSIFQAPTIASFVVVLAQRLVETVTPDQLLI